MSHTSEKLLELPNDHTATLGAQVGKYTAEPDSLCIFDGGGRIVPPLIKLTASEVACINRQLTDLSSRQPVGEFISALRKCRLEALSE